MANAAPPPSDIGHDLAAASRAAAYESGPDAIDIENVIPAHTIPAIEVPVFRELKGAAGSDNVTELAARIREVDARPPTLRDAMRVLGAIVPQLPHGDNLLFAEPALCALRALRDGAPQEYLIYREKVSAVCGRHVVGLLDRNVGPAPSLSPVQNQDCSPLDWRLLETRGAPPSRRWAIYGWLGFFINLLVGSGGTGKSLLAQQIGSHLVLGSPFIDTVVEPLRVLGWFCEDDHDEIWRRQVDIATSMNVGLGEFGEKLIIMPRLGMENALVTTEFGRPLLTPLIGELEEQANDHRADVVLLDNVAQLYGGGENDRHAVTFFMNSLSGALAGRAVLLLAHPARSTGSEFSGSGAWEAVARNRLFMGSHLPDQEPDPEAEPDGNVRYLARRKANYAAKDWRRFNYQDGVLVPDVVESGPTGIVAHIRDQATERVILTGLKRLQEMEMQPSEGAASPRYLPRLILEYKLGEGRTKKELADAMRRLMVDGHLVKTEVGKYANRSAMIGLKVAQ